MTHPLASRIPVQPLAGQPGSAIDVADLERAVRAADPCVLFVLPRILRRVIRQECELTAWTLRVPHRKSYVIASRRLLEIVEEIELGLSPGAVLPDTVILLPRPDSGKLAAITAGEALLRYWRLLFHARVHLALQNALAEERLTPAVLRQRVHQIGPVAFDEIRSVLEQEAFLLPPRDEAVVYVEFAAVFFELRYFAPSLLPCYFPGLAHLDEVAQILAHDLDADSLLYVTRPAGATEPVDVASVDAGEDLPGAAAKAEDGGLASWFPSEHEFRRMLRLGEDATLVGNTVRSLVYHARALEHAVGETVARTRIALRAGLDQLLQRLQRALQIPQEEVGVWREPLAALVHQTPRRFWPPEARFLYDLQKVCIDHEREIYRVDLLGWIGSLGRQPLKRPLPNQREVLLSKHLHSAAARLPVVRLPAHLRRQLSDLLHVAMERIEQRLRSRFRPLITAALDAVGLQPRNVPERVGRQKIVEELLDGVVERGYLAMGDLRDALSRNDLKLPDLSGLSNLFLGDQLLRADRRLAVSLDGVYRGGEFYLRGMQRLSSMGFGTNVGRWLTRYAFVPFIGAYVGMAGLDHLVTVVRRSETNLNSGWAVVVLGLFLAGLLNVEGFRREVWQACHTTWRVGREMLVDPLLALIRSEIVQRILHSRVYVLASRFLVRPLALTAVVYWLSPLELLATQASVSCAVSVFLAVNLAINSRLGRTAEEVFLEWIVHSWQRFGMRILAGTFWWIVERFKDLLEGLDRLLYTVDEWVRFRAGDTRLSIVGKAVLGPIWYFSSSLIRFLVNLIIEPQINPIKHFPTVTVAHKLLLPFIPTLAGVLELTMEKGLALTTATFIIAGIPGVFGFLVWELTGNWRLYQANRSDELRPMPIGHHGETMDRLLRPGFHSGTLPKRFAKLRRAERKARESGNWYAVRKHLHAIEQVETAVHRYIERELLTFLAQTPAWQSCGLTIGRIELGSNRVRVVLDCPTQDRPLTIGFDMETGWLLAGIDEPEWLARFDVAQRQVLANALAGLYKTSRVNVVRQQIKAILPLPAMLYRFTEEAMLVSPTAACDVEVCYSLQGEGPLFPQNQSPHDPLPLLAREDVLFSTTKILWSDWCDAWDHTSDVHRPPQVLVVTKLLN